MRLTTTPVKFSHRTTRKRSPYDERSTARERRQPSDSPGPMADPAAPAGTASVTSDLPPANRLTLLCCLAWAEGGPDPCHFLASRHSVCVGVVPGAAACLRPLPGGDHHRSRGRGEERVARLFSPPDPLARGCRLVRRCVSRSGGRLGDRRVRQCPARGGATLAGPACGLVVDRYLHTGLPGQSLRRRLGGTWLARVCAAPVAAPALRAGGQRCGGRDLGALAHSAVPDRPHTLAGCCAGLRPELRVHSDLPPHSWQRPDRLSPPRLNQWRGRVFPRA